MIALTKRQKAIVDSVPVVDVLADVGCDHGYIGLASIMSNRATKLHLLDISQPSLNKAIGHISEYNLDSQDITTACQNGLGDVLCDCCIVAGMGAREIIRIIDSAEHKPQVFVLQPMRNSQELRNYLVNNHYDITNDFTIQDNRFYDIIIASRSDNARQLTPLELLLGRGNIANPSKDYYNFLCKQLDKYNKLASKLCDEDINSTYQLLLQAKHLIGDIYE